MSTTSLFSTEPPLTTTSVSVGLHLGHDDPDLQPLKPKVKDIWLVDNQLKTVFTTVTLGFVGTILCSLGTIGNIINIIVFCKMGFRETINISFLGLAIADIGCLVTQLWLDIMYIPAFRNLAAWLLPFDPADPTFRNVTAAWPHICFSRITGLVTAYATLVRCLCIAMPLQVKTLLTPGRTVAVIAFIFVAMFAVVSPVFFTSPLGWTFSTKRNRTLYMQLGVDHEVEQITYGLSNVCGYIAFFVVILCTSVLITSLRRKAKWRKGVTGAASAAMSADDVTDGKPSQQTNKSAPGGGGVSKETKIIKLVVIISTVFIGSYFPTTAVFLVATALPGFSATGKYHNLFFMACSLTYNLEAINSSVNIFIYLNMSSKYRATFDAMFCKADTTSGTSIVSAKE